MQIRGRDRTERPLLLQATYIQQTAMSTLLYYTSTHNAKPYIDTRAVDSKTEQRVLTLDKGQRTQLQSAALHLDCIKIALERDWGNS